MITILTIFHVIVCLVLIVFVLLQKGNAADWSGAFGGGSSQTTFGSRGAGTPLGRITTAAAIIFMITSLTLTVLISRPSASSVIRGDAKQNQTQPAPAAAPATPPATGETPAQTPPPAPAPEKKQ